MVYTQATNIAMPSSCFTYSASISTVVCVFPTSVMALFLFSFFTLAFAFLSSESPLRLVNMWNSTPHSRRMQVPGWIEWHWGYKVSTLPVNLNSLLIRFQSYKRPQWGQSLNAVRGRIEEVAGQDIRVWRGGGHMHIHVQELFLMGGGGWVHIKCLVLAK